MRGGRGAGDPGGGGVPPEDKMAGHGGARGATTTAFTHTSAPRAPLHSPLPSLPLLLLPMTLKSKVSIKTNTQGIFFKLKVGNEIPGKTHDFYELAAFLLFISRIISLIISSLHPSVFFFMHYSQLAPRPPSSPVPSCDSDCGGDENDKKGRKKMASGAVGKDEGRRRPRR